MKKRDINEFIGNKYGRLTVLSEAGPSFSINGRKKYRLLCRCECGTEKPVPMHQVIHGRTISCGCLVNERIREANSTHGNTSSYKVTPEYMTWRAMKARCLNPKASNFHKYGAIGVTICQKWIESYQSFLEDMGKKPSRKHTIDRIDRNGNYEPSNCRWATAAEQCQNRKRTKRIGKMLTFDGRTQTVLEWSREIGVSETALYARIKAGWPVEKALFTPIRAKKKHSC